jgi:hypothetical protein
MRTTIVPKLTVIKFQMSEVGQMLIEFLKRGEITYKIETNFSEGKKWPQIRIFSVQLSYLVGF